jgi:hypothetical protein
LLALACATIVVSLPCGVLLIVTIIGACSST